MVHIGRMAAGSV